MLRFPAAPPARIAPQLSTRQICASSRRASLRPRSRLCATVRSMTLLLLGLAVLPGAIAQSSTPAAAKAPPNAQKPAAAQKIPRVTTTVVVQGKPENGFLPGIVSVGTLDGVPLQQAPLSATVVTRDLLNDQGARLLSDVVKNDASIGEDYAPVGYYGDYEIRGFPIDLATGLEINGMTIAGEQDVPLENKESVEFLKGIAGVESGVASAGGLINYVTKRPGSDRGRRSGHRPSRHRLWRR